MSSSLTPAGLEGVDEPSRRALTPSSREPVAEQGHDGRAAVLTSPDEKSAQRTQRPCTHCALPTPCSVDHEGPLFCCNGCRGAYQLIHGWGLEDYYALRDQVGSTSAPARGEQSGYEVFDNAEYLGLSNPQPLSDGCQQARLAVHGLHCGACAWLIEKAAQRTPGWRLARVRLSDHTLGIIFDPQTTQLSQIARLLDRLGYSLAPLTKQPDDHFRKQNRHLLIQIAIAGFCAANAMWIAVALYAGSATGVATDHRFFLRFMGTTLGIAAVLFPGRTFFTGALASLRTRVPHMDLPVALGLSVGTTVGLVNAITGRGDIYFDSLAVLVFLLLIGRWIQFHQQHRAAKAVDLLLRITPAHARRVDEAGAESWVLADYLRPGDVIRVAPGESIPADGELLVGPSMLDRSLLTGESRPVPVQVGEEVDAGTLNVTQAIDLRVSATGKESRIGRVMQSVEAATAEKTPVVQLADAIGGVFVVVVTLLALFTLGLWMFWTRDFATAAAHATSLLIVACPCALALATPLAIAVSLGRAAKRKILIRDGSSLQMLAHPGIVWFDKTGTLTEGRPQAQLIIGSEDAIGWAAAVEADCRHPVAEAIRREAQTRALDLPTGVDDVEVTRGGVRGTVEGHALLVGSATWIGQQGVGFRPEIEKAIANCLQQQASPIVIAVDGTATAVLAIADPLKADAISTVDALKSAGWQVGLLSGDHPEIVDHIAAQLGIPPERSHGGLLPEDKLARVRDANACESSRKRTVVMIGDGANDAAALAAAGVGIAVRGGAEVSLQAAPVFVASGRLGSLTELVGGARRTQRLIVTAFAVSLAYNLLAVGFAISGQISPLLAAILMPISSVSVLALTLLWPTFRGASP